MKLMKMDIAYVLPCRISGNAMNGPLFMHFQAIGDGKVVKREVSREAVVEDGVKVFDNDVTYASEGAILVWTPGKPKVSIKVRADQLRPL